MMYNRATISDFLECELEAQNKNFIQKLNTPAQSLLEQTQELFLGRFLGFKNGIMMLKMATRRGLPRKGQYFNTLILPAHLRDYHRWNITTYGDLIKQQDSNFETICAWYNTQEDTRFCVVGFKGVSNEIANELENNKGIILVLGPHIPPFEYLYNLQSLIIDNTQQSDHILDEKTIECNWSPQFIKHDDNFVDIIRTQLISSDTVILQGPPGTGKTTKTALLCHELISQNKSVLVTSLTNRALIELAKKSALATDLICGAIRKTNLSADELNELPHICKAQSFAPMKGTILLSTFYISSKYATQCNIPFDYVIMDEASQAILPMFSAAKLIGDKNLWIGDFNQLPPVIETNSDIIAQKGFSEIVEGFKTLSLQSPIPKFQLTDTFRLTARAARYTSIFYSGNLSSASNQIYDWQTDFKKFTSNEGGPILFKTDMPIGETHPNSALALTSLLISKIHNENPNFQIAVLSCFVATVKNLTRTIVQYNHSLKNIIIDTVARVQGITTDIAIFVIPNTSVYRSLEPRLFNVATSRSSTNTFIIADKSIVSMAQDQRVRQYLTTLDNEASFYFPTNTQQNHLTLEN